MNHLQGLDQQQQACLMRQPFEQAYKMGPLLGKGGFGKVYAGERVKDNLPVAVKVIKKSKITQWCKVIQRISPLFRCAHDNVKKT